MILFHFVELLANDNFWEKGSHYFWLVTTGNSTRFQGIVPIPWVDTHAEVQTINTNKHECRKEVSNIRRRVVNKQEKEGSGREQEIGNHGALYACMTTSENKCN